ncbi:MAG: type II secretion system F family protein [Lachnospiraceae bacterium]|nr:type II secretion system F family protein [Lachnospiraceae bacterium]
MESQIREILLELKDWRIVFAIGAAFILFMLIWGNKESRLRKTAAFKEFGGMLKIKVSKTGMYESLKDFLVRKGADYHFKKNLTPGGFLSVCIFMACIVYGVLSRVNLGMGILGSLMAFILPFILVIYLNLADNREMLSDIRIIYNALMVQVKAGIYLSDALSECCFYVKNNRIKDALNELSGDILMKADVAGALDVFQKKFENPYIDSLCITVVQALESGQAVELFDDLASQVKDMENYVAKAKKSSLDRKVTFYQLIMLTVILGLILYACIGYMMQNSFL